MPNDRGFQIGVTSIPSEGGGRGRRGYGNQLAPNHLRISAVLPAYNVAPYLAASVVSVLGQTFPVHETIVVDDGSTDDTPRVLAGYRDRIICLRQPNSGVSKARNTGVQRATGEWIAFLDGDDVWYPQKIERQLTALAPGVGFVFCWKHEFRDGENKAIRTVRYDQECCSNPLRAILTQFFASPSTVLVRRDVFLECGGFDETLRDGSEDADLWIRLAERTRFAQVEEPLVRYRLRNSSICGGQSARQYTEQIIGPLLRHRETFMRVLGMSRGEFESTISTSYLRFAHRWLNEGDYSAASWALLWGTSHFCRGVLAHTRLLASRENPK